MTIDTESEEPKKLYLYKPQAIVRDKRLTPLEQDYLCLIAQLSKKRNGCNASRRYFADYFGVSLPSAKEHLLELIRKGFLESSETKWGNKTIERRLEIVDPLCRHAFQLPSLGGNSDGMGGVSDG